MINTEILQDIITDHDLCAVQKRELLKTIAMIKQDRLIELPCAVGDTVYAIRYGEEKKFIIIPTRIIEIKQNVNGWFYVPSEAMQAFRPDDFGRIVFLTKEEAEAKLKELEGVKE